MVIDHYRPAREMTFRWQSNSCSLTYAEWVCWRIYACGIHIQHIVDILYIGFFHDVVYLQAYIIYHFVSDIAIKQHQIHHKCHSHRQDQVNGN